MEIECRWLFAVVSLLCCNLVLSSWIELLVPFSRCAAQACASAHCLAHRAASLRGRLKEWPANVHVRSKLGLVGLWVPIKLELQNQRRGASYKWEIQKHSVSVNEDTVGRQQWKAQHSIWDCFCIWRFKMKSSGRDSYLLVSSLQVSMRCSYLCFLSSTPPERSTCGN